ncbi:MAG TPA: translation initiation factor IF-2 [Thermoanaerobaculia bacterium]|nr:translation initiation factor IF-2 [Thermoanaerobaculia bacterium]
MAKIRVHELAQQMGVGDRELMFLLQSIGVQVASAQADLDESTVLAILQGKTHAPKSLIVREEPSRPKTTQAPKSALSRIKIIERPTAPVRRTEPPKPAEPRPRPPAEPARTAVVPSEPEGEASAASAPKAEPPKAPLVPRKIVLPPRRPIARPGPPPAAAAPARPGAVPVRPGTPPPRFGPGARPGPSVYRPAPGAPGARIPGARPPLPPGRPGVPGRPVRPGAIEPPVPADDAKALRRKKEEESKKAAAKKTGARPKINPADEVDLRDFVGEYQPDTYSDITLPLIDKNATLEEPVQPKQLSKSAMRRAGKETRHDDTGKIVEFKKPLPTGPVFLSEGVTVKELSEKLGVLARDLVQKLLRRGMMVTINQSLPANVAVEIAREIGVEAAVVSFEEEMELAREEKGEKVSPENLKPRAPVVTVMGHVDHGKTSLLDAIRETKVAASEAGGITQHIGAYRVESKGTPIVFLDTPGHEAFTLMRARGAAATDIVVLVVAADDGVMPQTVEAIDHARAAKVPIVVAINKIDKPNANVERVKKELGDRGVLLESWGGDVPSVEVSALKKQGIDQLLEIIRLVAELQELKADPTGMARGVVIEARREAGRGNVATVLVQSGALKIGDVFYAGSVSGRLRAMSDENGNRLTEAGPSTPVEVMGFEELPAAGDTFQVVENEIRARQIVSFRKEKNREQTMASTSKTSLEALFSRIQAGGVKDLAIILKADVMGSAEVLSSTLKKLSTEQVKVNVLHAGVGAINVNDVLLASASGAIIIGFNVRPEKKAETEAEKAGVDIRLYTVIYNITDDIRKAMEGLLEPTLKEVNRGRAEVRNTFQVPKVGVVAGCYVTEGTIPRSAGVRLLRDNRVVYEGKIASLRRFKDDVSEVKNGFECGIGLERYQDVKVGDVIEAFSTEKVAGVLSA